MLNSVIIAFICVRCYIRHVSEYYENYNLLDVDILFHDWFVLVSLLLFSFVAVKMCSLMKPMESENQ